MVNTLFSAKKYYFSKSIQGERHFPFVDMRLYSHIDPIIEELIFRLFIQKSVEWCAKKIMLNYIEETNTKNENAKNKSQVICIETAKKIALFVSSLFFVIHHTKTPMQLLVMFPGSLILGKLAETDGIISSIAAHMVMHTIHDAYYVLQGRELPL